MSMFQNDYVYVVGLVYTTCEDYNELQIYRGLIFLQSTFTPPTSILYNLHSIYKIYRIKVLSPFHFWKNGIIWFDVKTGISIY